MLSHVPPLAHVLLYQIADAGFLSKLHGVQAKADPHAYYFDFDPDVEKIVSNFKPYGITGERQ